MPLLRNQAVVEAALGAMRPFELRGFAMTGRRGAVFPPGDLLPYPHVPYGVRNAYAVYMGAVYGCRVVYTVVSYRTPIAWVTTSGRRCFVDETSDARDLGLSTTTRRHLSQVRQLLRVDADRIAEISAGDVGFADRLREIRDPGWRARMAAIAAERNAAMRDYAAVREAALQYIDMPDDGDAMPPGVDFSAWDEPVSPRLLPRRLDGCTCVACATPTQRFQVRQGE